MNNANLVLVLQNIQLVPSNVLPCPLMSLGISTVICYLRRFCFLLSRKLCGILSTGYMENSTDDLNLKLRIRKVNP